MPGGGLQLQMILDLGCAFSSIAEEREKLEPDRRQEDL
jgi:hypothetical protein